MKNAKLVIAKEVYKKEVYKLDSIVREKGLRNYSREIYDTFYIELEKSVYFNLEMENL